MLINRKVSGNNWVKFLENIINSLRYNIRERLKYEGII